MNLDERFTDVADHLSDLAGRWPHAAFWAVLIVVWLAIGPLMRFSDSWQLMANTPTTLIELFLCIASTAAANRLERRNRELHEILLKLVQKEEAEIQQIEAELGVSECPITQPS